MEHARRNPLLMAALAAGALCALLALVPTAWYAESFAHPARVARLGGAVPEATLHGALLFRFALAAGALLVPLLAFALVRACGAPARAGRRLWPSDSRGWVMLGAITAAGAAVRVALATESLWYDEISAFLSFAIEGPGVAFGSYAVPTNHVPMTLATWLSWTISGGSLNELVLRAPALLAGIAAIPAGYALAATVLPRRAAVLGAIAVAAAPIAVLESVEARGYAFVIFAAIVAATAFARAMRTRAATDYAVFACACAFGAWAHPVAILLPIAAGAVGLARDRRLAIAALLAGAIAAVLLSPLAGDMLAGRRDYLHSASDQPTVFSREGYEALLVPTLSWSSRLLSLPNALLTLIAAAGAVRIARRARLRAAVVPFGLAFALAFLLSIAFGTWIYARFLLFALPMGVLAMAAAGARDRKRTRLVGALLVLALADGLRGYTVKQPIRDAVAVVARQRAEGDAVATIGLPDNAVGFYAQQFGFEAETTGFLGSELAALLARAEPRFIIVLYPDRMTDDVLRTLDARFDRTHRLDGWADWGAGAVEVWRRAGGSALE
ncbi:MAG: hypothetical protein RL136_232 [Planctomycetota bacterium]